MPISTKKLKTLCTDILCYELGNRLSALIPSGFWPGLWEFKAAWHSCSTNNVSLVFCVLICSGGFAAAVTTPLDVAKTRIMLAKVRGSRTARKRQVCGRRVPALVQGSGKVDDPALNADDFCSLCCNGMGACCFGADNNGAASPLPLFLLLPLAFDFFSPKSH